MEYLLRSTQHKTIIARASLEEVYQVYLRKIEKYPPERFEIINALGEVVDVKDFEGGRSSGSDTIVRESLFEDSDRELFEDDGDSSERAPDSTD
jgi:hypothetical protein